MEILLDVLIWLAQTMVKFVLETFKPELRRRLRKLFRKLFRKLS